MKAIKSTLLSLSLLGLLAAGPCYAQATATAPEQQQSTGAAPQITPETQKDMTDSAQAALDWLKLVDNGDYSSSWDNAALPFQLKVPKASWTALLNVMRQPLGGAGDRKILEQRPALDPQGLPKGKYMVILYSTQFANRANGNELVTLLQTDSGQWKVLTYLVK